MNRITEAEKKRFHELLDESLLKLDSDKNCNKVHWHKLKTLWLQKMLVVESCELDVAVSMGDEEGIISECDDIINFAMFIKDNVSRDLKYKRNPSINRTW